MVPFVFLLVFVLFVIFPSPGNCEAPAQQHATEPWRRQAPSPSSAGRFKLPAAKELKLDNGLTIMLVEDHRAPLVTIEAGIPIAPQQGIGLESLSNFIALSESTAELLTEGAGSRTGSELAREVESLGGRIASSANEDYVEVSGVVVSENAPQMIELFADVVLRPTFPQAEVAQYKSNRVERLKVQRQDPAFLVDEMFDRAVYGSHPYSLSVPTPEAIRAVTRTGIYRFYKSSYNPAGSVLVIAGDFDLSKTEAAIEAMFSPWRNSAARRTAGEIKLRNPSVRKVYLIDRPGSEQADFRIGGLALKRADPDYFALAVANAVVGAGTASRLFLNIREKKGYAYDVYSSVSALKQAGTFFGASQTRTEVTAAAINEMLAELDRISREKVSDQELRDAKNFLTGQFALSLSTQGGVAGRLLHARVLGLEPDYLENYRSQVEEVTSDRVREVARKYVARKAPVIVVVGDARKLRKELLGIGAVAVFNSEGKRLQLK